MAPSEFHLAVARTARYFLLGEPSDAVTQVWFVCHGYGQLAARFVSQFAELDDGTRLIVAPEALSRFYLDREVGPHGPDAKIGATWMTREDRLREIDDNVRYLDALHAHVLAGLDRSRLEVTALGFSQGAATASRWMTLGSASADRLILWGGLPPGDLDLAAHGARLAALRLTIVLGTRDELATPKIVEGARATLAHHGVPYRLVTFDGGHRLDGAVLRSLAAERVR